MVHCRKLRDEIEIKKTEKQRLVNVRAKYKNEKHARQDTLSTSFRKTVMDIPCLSIPQLQVTCQMSASYKWSEAIVVSRGHKHFWKLFVEVYSSCVC